MVGAVLAGPQFLRRRQHEAERRRGGLDGQHWHAQAERAVHGEHQGGEARRDDDDDTDDARFA